MTRDACIHARSPSPPRSRSASPPPPPQPTPPCHRASVVKLERLGRPGTCPIYKVAIFSDGQVLYRGQQFVAVRGRRRAMLSSAELTEVVRAFTDAGFADLPRELWCDMTDTATSRRYVRRRNAPDQD